MGLVRNTRTAVFLEVDGGKTGNLWKEYEKVNKNWNRTNGRAIKQ